MTAISSTQSRSISRAMLELEGAVEQVSLKDKELRRKDLYTQKGNLTSNHVMTATKHSYQALASLINGGLTIALLAGSSIASHFSKVDANLIPTIVKLASPLFEGYNSYSTGAISKLSGTSQILQTELNSLNSEQQDSLAAADKATRAFQAILESEAAALR